MSEVSPAPDDRGEASHRTKGLLRLTMACNERCPFCNVPAEDYDRLTPDMAEAYEELDRFLQAGAQTLTISGGEPTLLRKRLLELVAHAKAHGVRFVEVQTNATLVKPAYARAMAEAGVTSAFVSFLSHVPELHDRLAGLEGAFDKCLAGMDAMIEAGIRVTLNPVTASITQELLPAFIDFVAERLPEVTFISMSAVQPHGRAQHNLDLLPDYAVLQRTVAEARRRAEAHGIELINPYCGLPVCVGWSDDLGQSVEAFEASTGGWQRIPGVNNLGNKAHGPACQTCALRTRCGGAWHAYWEVRQGSGIQAPVASVEPWRAGADAVRAQSILRATEGITPDLLDAASATTTPTVWVWTDRLVAGDAETLLGARVTELALEITDLSPAPLKAALKEVRRLARTNRQLQPQERLRVFLGFRPAAATNPRALLQAVSLAAGLGVDGIRLLSADPRWSRLVDKAAEAWPNVPFTALSPRPFLEDR